ncbi:HK97-gp10 family putative phage morphogenesis protein [Stagnihabitans tardus]|uniref:HK97 gp10 family phage protein n=1 Tax=Stagnihabitans tardus TaxID=2699202 RepID=A0AAE4YAZ6_9RHOB|nr:HK97-gp10 family putative phage morphogenesis protein [Stagnihabitans tardus]NBZ87908.1 HK97 gp10 family phage protein [Stagnihabitans tardus]
MGANGLASFKARLSGIPAAVRETLAGDLVEAATDVAAAVARIAPRDEGDLAASVAVTGPGQPTPEYSQPGGSFVVGTNAAAVTVGNSEVRYPHLVEYGTTKAPAQPFFWPAVNVTRGAVKAKIKAGMRRAIRGGK